VIMVMKDEINLVLTVPSHDRRTHQKYLRLNTDTVLQSLSPLFFLPSHLVSA
jgi:hypothetical protein